MTYLTRIVQDKLDDLFTELPAIVLEGAKGVGKTATARRIAAVEFALDNPAERELLAADLSRIDRGPYPILLDEWQRLPETWDRVRRAVDNDRSPGRYLLTGSASAEGTPTHTGAGRIVSIHMRPLSLAERSITTPTVSLGALLSGDLPNIEGDSSVTLEGYANEIVSGGFPGLLGLSQIALQAQLDGYIDRIVTRDFLEAGQRERSRNPAALRRWMTAYAGATATTATYEKIRNAATNGEGSRPAKSTTAPYRDTLEKLWILDPLPAWLPTRNPLRRLTETQKHHLVDTALAARLLGLGVGALLDGTPSKPSVIRDGVMLGQLFESLVTMCIRVYAEASRARVGHLRTKGGEHEVDLIVERDDRRVVAIEVKLSPTVSDEDVRHLHWLRNEIRDDLLDAAIITTGPYAYRRSDGIAVIPAALLSP